MRKARNDDSIASDGKLTIFGYLVCVATEKGLFAQ